MTGAVPWLGVVLVGAVAIAVWDGRGMRRLWSDTRTWAVLGAAVLGGLTAAVLLVHHEIGLRLLAPSNHDRSVEWSTALRQWASAPLFGVGPDRVLVFHAVDGTSASFADNEYLQVGADSGVVGIALLGFVAALAKQGASALRCSRFVLIGDGGLLGSSWHVRF